jgi:2,4-dichlorophenol 6-monooxygenase
MRLFEVPAALGASDDRAASRRAYDAVLADPARRRAVAEAIAHQAEHFDMLGLQLGFAYEDGALLADGEERAIVANPVRDFVPASRPGARLAHGWVRAAGEPRSTLDLIGLDRLTLLVGPEGRRWRDAARTLETPVPLACVVLGGDEVADPHAWWSSVAGMHPDGALLVRPDQHVAFRSRGAARDATAALRTAVAAALGGAASSSPPTPA